MQLQTKDKLKIGDLVICDNVSDIHDVGIIISIFQNNGNEYHAEVLLPENNISMYNLKELEKIQIEENI